MPKIIPLAVPFTARIAVPVSMTVAPVFFTGKNALRRILSTVKCYLRRFAIFVNTVAGKVNLVIPIHASAA